MNDKVLVVASAGGHLTQAMCAAGMCNNIILVSNKKNILDKRIKKTYAILDTQKNFFIHFCNIFYAFFLLIKERPKVVFSTGGPIVLPFALICKFLPVRFVYMDTLSRVVELSNTGRLIRKFRLYNSFFCQWEKIALRNNVQYIGKCFDILGEEKYELTTRSVESIPTILVTVGTNQYDFSRLFENLYDQPLYNNEKVHWVIQAAHNKLARMPANGRVVSMISRDEMELLVKDASLVISHCGIGSINLMLSYQKRVIFLPRVKRFREFSDDHQLQIASEVASKNFTVIMPEDVFPDLDLEGLLSIELLLAPVDTTNNAMSKKMFSVFFPSNNIVG